MTKMTGVALLQAPVSGGSGGSGDIGVGSSPSADNSAVQTLPKGSAAGNNGDKGVSGTPGSNGPSGGSDPHNDALPSPGGRAAHDAHIARAAHGSSAFVSQWRYS